MSQATEPSLRMAGVLEQLLTPKDLREILRLSSPTLTKLVASGELPKPIRVGKRNRWRLVDIQNFVGPRQDVIQTEATLQS